MLKTIAFVYCVGESLGLISSEARDGLNKFFGQTNCMRSFTFSSMLSVLKTESAHSRNNFPQQLLHVAEFAHDQVIASRASSYCMRSFTLSTVPLNVPSEECAQLKYMFRIKTAHN